MGLLKNTTIPSVVLKQLTFLNVSYKNKITASLILLKSYFFGVVVMRQPRLRLVPDV